MLPDCQPALSDNLLSPVDLTVSLHAESNRLASLLLVPACPYLFLNCTSSYTCQLMLHGSNHWALAYSLPMGRQEQHTR